MGRLIAGFLRSVVRKKHPDLTRYCTFSGDTVDGSQNTINQSNFAKSTGARNGLFVHQD